MIIDFKSLKPIVHKVDCVTKWENWFFRWHTWHWSSTIIIFIVRNWYMLFIVLINRTHIFIPVLAFSFQIILNIYFFNIVVLYHGPFSIYWLSSTFISNLMLCMLLNINDNTECWNAKWRKKTSDKKYLSPLDFPVGMSHFSHNFCI